MIHFQISQNNLVLCVQMRSVRNDVEKERMSLEFKDQVLRCKKQINLQLCNHIVSQSKYRK